MQGWSSSDRRRPRHRSPVSERNGNSVLPTRETARRPSCYRRTGRSGVEHSPAHCEAIAQDPASESLLRRPRFDSPGNTGRFRGGLEQSLASPRLGFALPREGSSLGRPEHESGNASNCRWPVARHGLFVAGRMLLMAALVSGLASISARADTAANPSRLLGALERCGTAFEMNSSSGYRCIVGGFGEILLDRAGVLAEQSGRQVFGDEFRLVNELSWMPGGGKGLLGTIDAVIPLSHTTGLRRNRWGATWALRAQRSCSKG